MSFNFDPNLELDHTLNVGPLGNPDLNVGAKAGFKAEVVIGSGITLSGPQTFPLVEASAVLNATQCSADSGVTTLTVLGQDFKSLLGTGAELGFPLKLPQNDDDRQACLKAFDAFRIAGDRAKKALHDAVELRRQYDERVMEQNDFGVICMDLVAQRPRGFPVGTASCSMEAPEDTINRFIEYYRRTVVGFSKVADGDGGGEGAIGLTQAADLLTASALPGLPSKPFKLYDFSKQEEETLLQAQFFIGPIPVNLELLATMDYGAFDHGRNRPRPGRGRRPMLRGNIQDPAQPIAFVSVDGMPHAGAGLALFAGVGFSVDDVSAKIGVEGAIQLGDVNITAQAGAGVGLGSEFDERPPPADMAAFVTGANLIPAKRYVAQLQYRAGLGAGIRNVLSGEIAATLKLKFAFFSKTWRQRLFGFTGFCVNDLSGCDLNLLSAAGTTDPASGPFPWGTIRSEMPFPELAPITVKNPLNVGSPAPDLSRVQQFLYDSFCTCIDGNDLNDARECFRNDDCCPAKHTCFSNPSTRKHECIDCEHAGTPCNNDGDCCQGQGLSCYKHTCRPVGECSVPCDRVQDCKSGLNCAPGPGCSTSGTCCSAPGCASTM